MGGGRGEKGLIAFLFYPFHEVKQISYPDTTFKGERKIILPDTQKNKNCIVNRMRFP